MQVPRLRYFQGVQRDESKVDGHGDTERLHVHAESEVIPIKVLVPPQQSRVECAAADRIAHEIVSTNRAADDSTLSGIGCGRNYWTVSETEQIAINVHYTTKMYVLIRKEKTFLDR